MRGRKSIPQPNVVSSVAQQTAQAAALADIAGQERLTDPRLNPAVRPHADRLRNDQQIKALDAENTRTTRQLQVREHRAADAERTLRVLAEARQMSSPARSVLALHRGRARFLRMSTAASLVLSAGSATGPGDLAAQYAHHASIGWIAEIGMVGLSTMAVLYRSHLGEHGGARQLRIGGKLTFSAKTLLALAVLPLMASVTANLVSHGLIGVSCSIGAAAFSLFSYVISDQSSAALMSCAKEVSDTDEAALRAVAMGEEDPITGTVPGPQMLTTAEVQAAVLDDLFAAGLGEVSPGTGPQRPELFSDEAIARLLGEPPNEEGEGEGGPIVPPAPGTDGPRGGAKSLPADEAPVTPRGRTDSDQHDHETGGASTPRGIEAATAARRAQGEENRARIAAYMAEHPNATKAEIAAAVGLHADTVKKHRRDINRAKREQGA